ncbi:MAG: RNase P subunit p30 family protein [Candidatus Odinarchaeota archaeon]
MAVDVGVFVQDMDKIGSFGILAHEIGFTGIAVPGLINEPFKHLTEGIIVYGRINIVGKGVNSLRNQIERVRKNTPVVAVQVGSIDSTNWAVEDKRVDLLTLDPSKDHRLRETTACLCSNSSIALEIQIAPLLYSSGLQRSKILKTYREAVITAVDAGMGVVLSSGATHLLGLRSPTAMVHIGMLLGIDRTLAERAVHELPTYIIERSLKRLSPKFVSPGVEIIKRRENP